MSRSLLLNSFELLATASGAMTRLRKLILTLAVQGKLVPQDNTDEPASELIREIHSKKSQLTTQGKIKRDKPLVGISEDEKPFELPAGWEWIRFGEASINRDGERIPISSSERNNRAKVYDYYGASGVIDKIDGFLFDKTLLLIGEDGANLINRSTPIAFLAHGKYWVNNHAHVIDTTHSELMRYLELFINAMSLEPYVTGTAQPKMNQAKLNSIVIALPPLAEQSRIFTRVDELMKLCDAIEQKGRLTNEKHAQLISTLFDALGSSESAHELTENWQRVSGSFDLLLDRTEAIDALEQALVQLAVKGLLTPQESNDGQAISLLAEQIEAANASSERRSRTELQPVDTDSVPFEIPSSWVWCKFGEVVHVSGGVTLGRKGVIPNPVSLPYLRVANVQRGGLNLDKEVKEVTIDLTELPRFLLKDGDLLITEGGDWDKVGRTCTWRSEIAQCLHQNHVFKVRGYTPNWLPEWGELYLNSPSARQYFAASSKQTTNLASINMTELRNCLFPLPPLAEQRRILAKVRTLTELCRNLRATISKAEFSRGLVADALFAEPALASQ